MYRWRPVGAERRGQPLAAMRGSEAEEADSASARAVTAAEAMARAAAIDTTASFGIDEGEVDQLERKWNTWSYEVEENKSERARSLRTAP